jgi:hypothetical protein
MFSLPARALFFFLCLALLSPIPCPAHTPGEEMTAAANNWLAALSPEQRTKATFEFKNEERFDWHFIPKSRLGLPIKEMSQAQRALAMAVLGSGLSQRGFAKASTIMSLEQVLHDIETSGPVRDAELYYFTVFGQPGKGPWGWRVEGHHLSLNFTLQDNEVLAVTPSFLGTNPANVQSGPRQGLRVLAAEEDLARTLVKSLDPAQSKSAIVTNSAPGDIITGNSRKARVLEPVGISASSLTPAQRTTLVDVIKEYVYRCRAEIADHDLAAILKAGDSKLYFAWAGGLEPGDKHYYRVQGPTFLLEYDNTQNNANHIHAVWRDLENDFGDDLLRRHYEQVPHSN